MPWQLGIRKERKKIRGIKKREQRSAEGKGRSPHSEKPPRWWKYQLGQKGTFGGSKGDAIDGGMLYRDGDAYFARNYLIHLVDRVGGGDSFGGGLIHAMRKWPEDQQKQIEFAVAASCLKQATEYDFNLASEKEVLALAGGNASGRVQR